MTEYTAYGLRIQSDHVLHFASFEHQARTDAPLLRMQWCGVLWDHPSKALIHRMPDYKGGPVLLVWLDGDAVCIDYAGWQARFVPGAGTMEIAPADPIVPAMHVAERVWVPFYAMCSFEDVIALHGSAIGMDGRAHVILGPSGAGKSTTAMACVAQGATLLSDDMVLVNVSTRMVYPAAPTLRLWQPPIEQLDVLDEVQISPASEKRWYRIASQAPSRLPLQRVLLLARDPNASMYGEVEDMKGMTAMLAVLRNAFDWEAPPAPWAHARLERARKLLAVCPVQRLMFCSDPAGQPLHVQQVIA